jgi:hypothetical protein
MKATGPLTVFCPKCGARPGEPCISTNMPPDSYHSMRRVVAHNTESDDAKRKRITQEMLKP